jgi:bla regulator protein blaR1
LKVCRLYLESPLECVAGVTGADLKKRIEGIMTGGAARELDFARKVLLAVAGFVAIAAPVAMGVLNAPTVRAQGTPEGRLTFEVASVKPANLKGPFALDFSPNGRFTARGVPLVFLIAAAYNIPYQSQRLAGLSPEMAGEAYEVEANAESGAIPSGASRLVREAKMRLMLQSLLEDRFKLKMRRETKDLPVYVVVVGKNGPKLTKSKVEDGQSHQFFGGQGRGLHSDAVSMADLALAVSNFADRPVIDRTGIEGLFEINTEGWVPMRPRPGGTATGGDAGIDDPERPTLYMIFERLGLKMESSKAPVEMFVVEHIEKPSGN